nr:pilus assembly protein PilB [Marinobacter sp. ATCH36]
MLINRGYLSVSQLQKGLRLQQETGQRLGEVFVQSGWITERELQRVLKHQSRYRNAAALVTMAVLPFQPLVSFAASNGTSESRDFSEAGQLYEQPGFAPMNDKELAGVYGQGREQGDIREPEPEVVEGLTVTTNIFVPLLNFLDSDLTITGVHYRGNEPRYELLANGGMRMAFPERIEQIRMDNIRVSGSRGPSMGNITIDNIRFHPDSKMTIYTR